MQAGPAPIPVYRPSYLTDGLEFQGSLVESPANVFYQRVKASRASISAQGSGRFQFQWRSVSDNLLMSPTAATNPEPRGLEPGAPVHCRAWRSRTQRGPDRGTNVRGCRRSSTLGQLAATRDLLRRRRRLHELLLEHRPAIQRDEFELEPYRQVLEGLHAYPGQ